MLTYSGTEGFVVFLKLKLFDTSSVKCFDEGNLESFIFSLKYNHTISEVNEVGCI